jgi:hypothetical protein
MQKIPKIRVACAARDPYFRVPLIILRKSYWIKLFKRLEIAPGSGGSCQVHRPPERFQLDGDLLVEAAVAAVLQYKLS